MRIAELPIADSVKEVLAGIGICELFPPQEACIQAGVLEGQNILLASPTASGKTLIAELCAMKQILENGGKVIYLSPLRALASEKFVEFKKYTDILKPDGRKVAVGISTGDFDTADNWLERYDVIVTTNEKADSLLRHRAKWMENITAVIADEVHLLNEADRGPTLEIVLARLMQCNPHIQILALSATVNNVDELAGWLNAKPVVTTWRPINLKRRRYPTQTKSSTKTANPANRAGNPFTVINMVLNTLRNGASADFRAFIRKNAVSAATGCAHMDKVLIPEVGFKDCPQGPLRSKLRARWRRRRRRFSTLVSIRSWVMNSLRIWFAADSSTLLDCLVHTARSSSRALGMTVKSRCSLGRRRWHGR